MLKSLFNSLTPYFELGDALPTDIAAFKIEEAIRILRAIDPAADGLLGYFEVPGKLDLAGFMEQNFRFNLSLEKFGYLTGRSLTTFKKILSRLPRAARPLANKEAVRTGTLPTGRTAPETVKRLPRCRL